MKKLKIVYIVDIILMILSFIGCVYLNDIPSTGLDALEDMGFFVVHMMIFIIFLIIFIIFSIIFIIKKITLKKFLKIIAKILLIISYILMGIIVIFELVNIIEILFWGIDVNVNVYPNSIWLYSQTLKGFSGLVKYYQTLSSIIIFRFLLVVFCAIYHFVYFKFIKTKKDKK